MLLFLSNLRMPCCAARSLFTTHRIAPPLTRCCSSSSPSQYPHPDFTIADYLISSFGFSADKAAKLSKPISHLKTPQNPDSVRRFLHELGLFSENDIRKLITRCPRILCSSPDKTLAPSLTALRDIGLPTAALTQLILSSPAAIMFRSAAPTIKFWLDFFGGNEEALVTAVRHYGGIVGSSITRVVAPNISVLRNHGLSTHEMRMVVLRVPRLINTGPALLEDMLIRAEELGFRPGSSKFAQSLHAMHVNSREMLRKKMELFASFGWSEDRFLTALRKAPLWATLSEKTLQAKMDFFVGEARCDPSYIASYPMLLAYSLEKRLRPRIRVLRLLELKGYCEAKKGFYAKICQGNQQFVETYVSSHKEEIPELLEAYHAGCAS